MAEFKQTVHVGDLGLIDFDEAWDIQRKALTAILQEREKEPDSQKAIIHRLFFCEHPHVYTIGKSGSETNLLVNEQALAEKGVRVVKIDRGGDITYHGPGQIVCYPVFNLTALNIGVKKYVDQLEEAVIITLNRFGLQGERLPQSTGVWLETGRQERTRKICAIGVKVSRSVTMHGLALNVNTDLSFFNLINPCGFTDKGVTSMATELGRQISISEVKKRLLASLQQVFRFADVSDMPEDSR